MKIGIELSKTAFFCKVIIQSVDVWLIAACSGVGVRSLGCGFPSHFHSQRQRHVHLPEEAARQAATRRSFIVAVEGTS